VNDELVGAGSSGPENGYTSYVWNIVITNLTKEKEKEEEKKPL
jgi:hypothetical protein